MRLWLNGEARDYTDASDVAALVAQLPLPAPTLLIEHNGTALRRDEWSTSTLRDGDQIEVISIVAGG